MIAGRVALVTGGTRGIGLAIAKKLASDGFALAVMGTRGEADAAESLGAIAEAGACGGERPPAPVVYIQGNLSQHASRKLAVDSAMRSFGRIDLLVNNAGVAPKERADILETTEESMDFVLDTNLKGTFFMTQAVALVMVDQARVWPERRLAIVNISSVSAYTSSVQRGEYCISKAGVSMVTALFADRLAEYGIGVHEVRPGIIRTDMTSGVTARYDALIAGGLTPIRRWGHPDDVAEAVSVLASGRLPFSTGEVLNVDGGFHLRRL